MLSEEEIINKIYKLRNVLTILNDYGKEDVEAIDGLLDLYNKEKKENNSLEQENQFLKMIYRETDEFKAIERMAGGK